MLLKTSFLLPHLFCNVDFELIWLIEFLNKKSIEIIGFELTQPARDAPEGTNNKNHDLMRNVFFTCNGLCFTHLLLFFTGKTNIKKL